MFCCSFFFFFSRLGCWPWPLLPLFIYSRAPRAALYHYEQFNLPSAYPLPSPLLLILLQINDRAVCVCVCCTAEQQQHTRTPTVKKKKKRNEKKKTSAAPCSAPALSLPHTEERILLLHPPHNRPPLFIVVVGLSKVDSFPAPAPPTITRTTTIHVYMYIL